MMKKCTNVAILLSFCGCVAQSSVVELNVFIHGGGLHPAYFSVSDFFSVLHEQVDKSLYARTTNLLRYDPFFFQVQPMDFPGLKRAYPIKNILYGSHIFGAFYDKIYRLVSPTSHKTLYYAFGWEALLHPQTRRNAGARLYLELAAKVDQLKRRGYTPYVRVIGYSHGGNVVLSAAEQARNYPKSFLTIDELILISTPIQPQPYKFVTSSLFKKVYLFYSTGDRVQTTDFLSSPRHTFSRHTLPKEKNCAPYCKITQIQVRIVSKVIPTKRTSGQHKNISNFQIINPNHSEMFFFGWTPEWYRTYLPIRPFSVGLLVPIMLKYINQFHLQGHFLRITINPYKERMLIVDKETHAIHKVPFFKHKQFSQLQRNLWQYQPKGFNDNTKFKAFYHKRMKIALKKARLEKQRQRKQARTLARSRANGLGA